MTQHLGEKCLWEVPRNPNGASQMSSKWLHTLQNVFTFLMHAASHIYLCGSCYLHSLVKEDDSGWLVRLVGQWSQRSWTFWLSYWGKGFFPRKPGKCHLVRHPLLGSISQVFFLVEDFIHPAKVQLCSQNLVYFATGSRRVSPCRHLDISPVRLRPPELWVNKSVVLHP